MSQKPMMNEMSRRVSGNRSTGAASFIVGSRVARSVESNGGIVTPEGYAHEARPRECDS